MNFVVSAAGGHQCSVLDFRSVGCLVSQPPTDSQVKRVKDSRHHMWCIFLSASSKLLTNSYFTCRCVNNTMGHWPTTMYSVLHVVVACMINNAVAAPTSDFHRDDVWSVSVGLTGDLLPSLIHQPLISANIIG
jgi:hypothetical protein